MGMLTRLFQRGRNADTLSDLLAGDFNVMFLPLFHLLSTDKPTRLPSYRDRRSYICTPLEAPSDRLNVRRCKKHLAHGDCVVIELDGLGSFVFTRHKRSDLFLNLQKRFRETTNYVFCASDTGGYFKILKDGRIQRKIASNMISDGIGNNPETRGEPCAYELETGHIFKINYKAGYLRDMLSDFTRQEVLALFDYYIGMKNFNAENVRRVLFYALSEA